MTVQASLSRRGVVTGATALAGLAALDPVRIARAAGELPPLGQFDFGQDDFMALSRVLTGHTDLDSGVGEALLGGLNAAGHRADLAILYDALRSAAGDQGVKDVLARGATAQTARHVLRGWYTGLVEAPGGLVRVAYEGTLMGVVVEDFMPLRSNCGGDPHFWVEPPKLADLPLDGKGAS